MIWTKGLSPGHSTNLFVFCWWLLEPKGIDLVDVADLHDSSLDNRLFDRGWTFV